MSAQLDDTEVWNRAAGGPPEGGKAGDIALGRALAFHGFAEGDGVIAAMEVAMEEEGLWATADAFLYFGLDDVSAFIRSGHRRLARVWELDSDAREAELDEAFGEEYAMDVEQGLTDAPQARLASHPEDFATLG